MNWLRRSWFRHPLSLRPDGGFVSTGWLGTGELGFPRLYWNFDEGWHAKNQRFIGVMWQLGPRILWFGLKDSN